jgi:prepilin-type processing-associated H-X9-DG protein
VPNDPVNHFDDFSSRHKGGAHFLVADGSVRRIDKTVRLEVFRGVATRAGGEYYQFPR